MMNKTKNECETKLCQYETATRTRFYNGMLLTAEHLRAEQDYHRDALKRLTRHLFGSGIVCGLDVEGQEVGLCIKVQPGVAIDCCGNLIEVCKCVTIDLSKECEKCHGSDCIPANPPDPKEYELKRYLVLRYNEKETDPEPILTADDECKASSGKTDCNASKTREGFCIELWKECPCEKPEPDFEKTLAETLYAIDEQAKQKTPGTQQSTGIQQSPNPLILTEPCSPCGCCENAVGLAELTIHCDTKKVEVSYDKCRPEIIGARLLEWIISKFQEPTYESKELAYLSSRLDHGSKATLIRAVLSSEERGKQIGKLQQMLRPIPEFREAVSQIKGLQKEVYPLREQREKYKKELSEARDQLKEFDKVLKELTNRVTKLEAKKAKSS